MNRPWIIWSVLCGCALLIMAMLGWMTQRSLAAEQERVNAQAEADYGERIRLSLSRMDTIGANILVVENQRPPLHYQPFFSPGDIFTANLYNISPQTILQPSPLLTGEADFALLHFEFRSNGELISPQVPLHTQRDLAIGNGVPEDTLSAAQGHLERLQNILPKDERFKLAQMALRCEPPKGWKADEEKESQWIANNDTQVQTVERQQKYEEVLNRREKKVRSASLKKAVAKASSRSVDYNQAVVTGNSFLVEPNLVKDEAPPRDQLASLIPFQPVWLDGELLLVREVTGSLSTKYQGVWLDHKKLKEEFESELPIDLQDVKIVPSERGEDSPLELVSLPWELIPGKTPAVVLPLLTPMRKTITMGWIGALFALAALFLLLRGVIKLSERRAAFVSSVTHELRTPLTTFRLYSEMLADGMVPDEETKQEYLRTMQGESERLNHLVENVLSYSQIERGTARSKFEKLAVADLVERLRPVLQRRIDQEDAALSIEITPDAGEVETDVTAVEQILFNLIDNACKYGLPESGNGHVSLTARRDRKGLAFEVSDNGKGVQRHERKRLFQAFHKSASDAAHSKPGVGLGLALCRRLAKALGGNLTLGAPREKGASFVLQIP